MVVIDATNLLLFLRPDTPVSADANGVPIDRPKERIDYLIKRLDQARTKIVIPTPALSEALVRAGAAATQKIIELLQSFAIFRIEPFDTRAAIEVALMTRQAIAKGNKRGASTDATWAKIKYDRQIVAVARVCGADVIYSDDKDIANCAKEAGIATIPLSQLPLPPEKAQMELTLTGAAESAQPPRDDEAESEDQTGRP